MMIDTFSQFLSLISRFTLIDATIWGNSYKEDIMELGIIRYNAFIVQKNNIKLKYKSTSLPLLQPCSSPH